MNNIDGINYGTGSTYYGRRVVEKLLKGSEQAAVIYPKYTADVDLNWVVGELQEQGLVVRLEYRPYYRGASSHHVIYID